MARIMGRSIQAMETVMMIPILPIPTSKIPGTIPTIVAGINPTAAEITAGHSRRIMLRRITARTRPRITTAAGHRILPTTRTVVTLTSSTTAMEDHGTTVTLRVAVTTAAIHPVDRGTAAITLQEEEVITAVIHPVETAHGVAAVTHPVVAVATAVGILPVEVLMVADILPVEEDSAGGGIHQAVDSVEVEVADTRQVVAEEATVTGKNTRSAALCCSTMLPVFFQHSQTPYLHFT